MAIYKKILGLFPLMIVLTMIWGCGNHMDKSSESFDITKFPRDEQGYPKSNIVIINGKEFSLNVFPFSIKED